MGVYSEFFDRMFFEKRSSQNMQVDALDGARGLAIIFVVLQHMSSFGMLFREDIHLNRFGSFGVFIFFSLSAYLLTYQFLARDDQALRRPGIWVNYFIRRVVRVYPLYIIVLLTGFGLSRIEGLVPEYNISWPELVNSLLLVEGKHVYWIIPVMFKYYAVLPVVVLAAVFVFKRSLQTSLVGIATVLVAVNLARPLPPLGVYVTTIVQYFLPIFLFGSFAGLMQFRMDELSDDLRRKIRRGLGIVGALCIFALIIASNLSSFTQIGKSIPNAGTNVRMLISAGVLMMLVFGAANGIGPIIGFLASKPMRFLGITSYSMYMWHYPILLFFNYHTVLPSAVRAVLFLLLSVAVSMFSYLLLERPFSGIGFRDGRLTIRSRK